MTSFTKPETFHSPARAQLEEYCGVRVCLFVCLYVCQICLSVRISQQAQIRTSPNFLSLLPACGRAFVRRYDSFFQFRATGGPSLPGKGDACSTSTQNDSQGTAREWATSRHQGRRSAVAFDQRGMKKGKGSPDSIARADPGSWQSACR